MYRGNLKKRIVLLSCILIIFVTFAGCQEKDTLIESAFPDITVTHSPDSSDSDNSEEDPDLKPESVGSVKELIKSKGEEYQVYYDRPEIEAYNLYLQEHYHELRRAGSEDLHIEIGFVNEDDIPELFIGWGTYHIAGIHILTYNAATGSAIYLGEFSSFGFCNYNERKNRIRSQYGNHGYYEQFISQIVDDHVELVGACLDDAGKVEEKFYANYPVDERITGSRHEIDPMDLSDQPDEQYLVSEDEYDKVYDGYFLSGDDANTLKVHYDDMTPILY